MRLRLAALALVATLAGSSLAAAQTGSAPADAYHYVAAKDVRYARSTVERLIAQVIVPAKRSYVVTGKLVVRKAATGTKAGPVTCWLGGLSGPRDRAMASLEPGQAATLSFDYAGTEEGSSVADAALDLSCRSPQSGFTMSDLRITVRPVATLKTQ
jgi:hypothetical protein